MVLVFVMPHLLVELRLLIAKIELYDCYTIHGLHIEKFQNLMPCIHTYVYSTSSPSYAYNYSVYLSISIHHQHPLDQLYYYTILRCTLY